MPAKLEEIEGRFTLEFFRRATFMLGEVQHGDDVLTIKGECDPDELRPKADYRFYGRFLTYKGERQFAFQTFVPIVAHDRDGVIEYLARAGVGLGMGRGTARKCWEAFGADAVREIRQAPRLLRDLNPRITDDQCDQIGDILTSQKATEDATIELTNLLAGRGFPKTTARKAIRKWGNKAARIIRRDPYSLMAFRGCGFKLCDALYIELGHSPSRLKRQALCAWHAIAANNDGHTWHPVAQVAQAVSQTIGGTDANPKRAIQLALRLAKRSPNHYGALAAIRADGQNGPIVDEGGSVWIAEGRRAEAERDLAKMVAKAVGEQKHESLWPDPYSLSITDHQKAELDFATRQRVGILAGGAGCGKTFTVARVIHAILKSGVGAQMIGVAGPTGKSAVRVTEMMQASGLNLKATTIHSMLGVGQADDEGGEWGFIHGKDNPLPYSVIVVDEASMVDTALMRSLFAARARGCHVLLVGDPAQLPPVGNGAPLRDMIRCGVVGYGELKEIKRTDNEIAFTCQAIRNGQPWEANNDVIVSDSAKDQIAQVVEALRDARSGGFDPVWDCQVLVAVNQRSPLSRKIVNQELQSVLNPNPEVKGTPFRLADKIVCLKNGRYRDIYAEDDDEVYVANGELGKVVKIEDKAIIAELWNPARTVRIPRGKADGESSGCNWDLAYGLSTHKSQGSEWPVVITLVDEYAGAKRICSREWLYTAVSRAKQQAILIGKKSTADAMCRRVAIGKRTTMLRQLIQLENGKRVLEGI